MQLSDRPLAFCRRSCRDNLFFPRVFPPLSLTQTSLLNLQKHFPLVNSWFPAINVTGLIWFNWFDWIKHHQRQTIFLITDPLCLARTLKLIYSIKDSKIKRWAIEIIACTTIDTLCNYIYWRIFVNKHILYNNDFQLDSFDQSRSMLDIYRKLYSALFGNVRHWSKITISFGNVRHISVIPIRAELV